MNKTGANIQNLAKARIARAILMKTKKLELTDGYSAADGYPQTPGMVYLRKYWTGTTLTRKQAIIATCAECNGFYVDGRRDCEIDRCPLYQWMPYRMGRKKYSTSASQNISAADAGRK